MKKSNLVAFLIGVGATIAGVCAVKKVKDVMKYDPDFDLDDEDDYDDEYEEDDDYDDDDDEDDSFVDDFPEEDEDETPPHHLACLLAERHQECIDAEWQEDVGS